MEESEVFDDEEMTMGDSETIDQSVSYISEDDGDDDGITEDDESVSNLIKSSINDKYEIISNNTTYEKYYTENKKSKPFITKYEKAKLLGVRAQMLSTGSPAMITVPKNVTSTLKIAELEFEQKKIPLFIRRYLPNKEYEDWRLEELITS